MGWSCLPGFSRVIGNSDKNILDEVKTSYVKVRKEERHFTKRYFVGTVEPSDKREVLLYLSALGKISFVEITKISA